MDHSERNKVKDNINIDVPPQGAVQNNYYLLQASPFLLRKYERRKPKRDSFHQFVYKY